MHSLLINCYMPAAAERLLSLELSPAPRQQEPLAGVAAVKPDWASPFQAGKRGVSASQAPPDSEAQANGHYWVV